MRYLLITASIFFGAIQANSQTTITLQPGPTDGKDAELFSCVPCGYATTNFGSIHKFQAAAWTNQGASSDAKSLISFDLSAIPSNATIVSAELSLYFNPDDGDGPHSSLTNSNEAYLRRVTSSWDEMTVTWNSQPSVSTVNQVYLPESTSPTQNYTDINVTNLIQDIVNDPANSYGLILESASYQEYHGLYFASSDHQDSQLHPKLVITYIDSNSNVDELSTINFQLIPNPTSESFSLKSEGKIELVEIFNAQGQLLISVENQFESIEVMHLSPGTYIVRVRNENGIGSQKLVVE